MNILENQKCKITITDMGSKGEAIGKADGYVIFTDEGIIGDEVEVVIEYIKKNCAYAHTLRIIKESKYRVKSKCPVSKICGGCSLQELEYSEQLKLKKKIVKENFKRIAGKEIQIDNVIGMTNPYRYRNKGQYPIGYLKNEVISGFYKTGTHEIAPVKDCILHKEISNNIVFDLTKFFQKNKVSIYNENTKTGNIRRIVIKIGFKTSEIMVIIVTKHQELNYSEQIVGFLTEKYPSIKTIVQNIQHLDNNVILGKQNKILYGDGKITDILGNLTFEISPNSFYQVNPVQTEKLYDAAIQKAGFKGDETVLDLYCGIGTISLFASKYVKKVIGVEIISEAVENAKNNMKLNKISNVEFISGKAEELFEDISKKNKIDALFLDPPRKGCDKRLILETVKQKIPKIIYISCNSATLARDALIFEENGYEVKNPTLVDMFCHGMNIESVVLISRKET